MIRKTWISLGFSYDHVNGKPYLFLVRRLKGQAGVSSDRSSHHGYMLGLGTT